ncbi:hypothetical protein MPLA_2130013 [Mesorhizobium sp. ORS 3359]|nr:hypothetical protein MPLA_2130013 [Mesorhizobium sp. ORS 3359]
MAIKLNSVQAEAILGASPYAIGVARLPDFRRETIAGYKRAELEIRTPL